MKLETSGAGMWARMKQGHSSGSPMSLGHSEGTRGPPSAGWLQGPRPLEEGALEHADPIRLGLFWSTEAAAGPSLCAPLLGCLVVLMETCPRRQRPAPPCLGQRSWVSPALVLLRIWLQASGGGSSGTQPSSARRSFSVEVTTPPQPTLCWASAVS